MNMCLEIKRSRYEYSEAYHEGNANMKKLPSKSISAKIRQNLEINQAVKNRFNQFSRLGCSYAISI